MKFLLTLLCITTLLSCNDTTGKKSGGTLYVESSIVGGLRISWLWLGDDGTFVRNPVNGVDPVNYALEKTTNAAQTGHYTKQDNKLSATYENGRTETWAMEYDGNRLNTIDGLFVGQAEEMPDNYPLSGSYAANTFYGQVANVSTFNFTPDGKFTLQGEGFVSTEDAGANAKSATGGTYKVSGNTLQLNFNNGQSTRSVIGIYKSGNSNFLIINQSFFSKAD